jgi:hypothetical protein
MYLIVANQTLGGAELGNAIRERIDRGDARFRVVVPLTEPREESPSYLPADPIYGIPDRPPQASPDLGEGRRRSQHRCDRLLEAIRTAGGSAEGYVGDPDPYDAACQALEADGIDEVIVSTLPPGMSRWMRMDLPSRISRATDVPVTTIEAVGPDDD